MDSPFRKSEILYYPTIEFRDSSWLRSALSIWDKIYRIKPIGYIPNDTSDVKIAIANGLIEEIELTASDLTSAASKFAHLADKLEFIPSGFSSSTYEVSLHQDKVDKRLHDFFRSFHGESNKLGFYKIPEEIANGYMFYLAEAISRKRNIPKLTDDQDMFAAMSYVHAEGKFGEWICDPDASEVYVNLVIDRLVPADIDQIDMDILLKRNQRFGKAKTAFRVLIEEFMEDFINIEDPEFAKSRLDKFQKSMIEHNNMVKEDLKTISNEFYGAVLYGGFSASAFAVISAIGKSLGPIDETSCLVAGVAFGGVATLNRLGAEIRKKRKPTGVNYYVDLLNKIPACHQPRNRHWNVNNLIEEFVND